ncbi:MAG: putative bifunctional diguanylate cyclase/phosphodiesterase, partial [Burkholderiales bacterium]
MTDLQADERRPLVLLADDDEAARLLIEVALIDANLRVVQALDGQEAVDAFSRERPDIVLLDVNMPVMDGYAACRALRALPGGESVPVLMVTEDEGMQSIDRAYAAGATDFLTKSSNWVIVAHRVRYMLRAARALVEAGNSAKSGLSGQCMSRMPQDASERPGNDENICRPDQYDSLTGLPSRVMFGDQLSRAIAGCARTGERLALIFLDLDLFKRINHACGHAVGDRVLAAAAERIAACVSNREAVSCGRVDEPAGGEAHQATKELHRLGRPGGDEFCLFLANIGEPRNAAKIARRILAELARPITIGPHEIALGASIGIAMYPTDGEDGETLSRNAEAATYQAKDAGRNNYRFFARAMNAEAFDGLSLENALRRAVDNGEFVLHYQPVVGFADGRVVGAEALIRWQHPELGLVLPAEFLSLAEDTGLIIPIGEWVIEQACRQAVAWRSLTPSPLRMSVNVSAVHFRHRALRQSVNRALQACALDARLLTLELPESALKRDAQTTLAILRQLAGMGVHLCVDNFGAGYSSFMSLRRFPLRSVKMDRSFVLDLPG